MEHLEAIVHITFEQVNNANPEALQLLVAAQKHINQLIRSATPPKPNALPKACLTFVNQPVTAPARQRPALLQRTTVEQQLRNGFASLTTAEAGLDEAACQNRLTLIAFHSLYEDVQEIVTRKQVKHGSKRERTERKELAAKRALAEILDIQLATVEDKLNRPLRYYDVIKRCGTIGYLAHLPVGATKAFEQRYLTKSQLPTLEQYWKDSGLLERSRESDPFVISELKAILGAWGVDAERLLKGRSRLARCVRQCLAAAERELALREDAPNEPPQTQQRDECAEDGQEHTSSNTRRALHENACNGPSQDQNFADAYHSERGGCGIGRRREDAPLDGTNQAQGFDGDNRAHKRRRMEIGQAFEQQSNNSHGIPTPLPTSDERAVLHDSMQMFSDTGEVHKNTAFPVTTTPCENGHMETSDVMNLFNRNDDQHTRIGSCNTFPDASASLNYGLTEYAYNSRRTQLYDLQLNSRWPEEPYDLCWNDQWAGDLYDHHLNQFWPTDEQINFEIADAQSLAGPL